MRPRQRPEPFPGRDAFRALFVHDRHDEAVHKTGENVNRSRHCFDGIFAMNPGGARAYFGGGNSLLI